MYQFEAFSKTIASHDGFFPDTKSVVLQNWMVQIFTFFHLHSNNQFYLLSKLP